MAQRPKNMERHARSVTDEASDSSTRVYRDHDDAVAVIQSAAAEMIAQVGHEAFSLRKLAGAIGYSPAAIYRHFENKDELISAIIEAGFDDLRGRMSEAAKGESPQQCVAACFHAYVDFAMENPSLYKMLFVDRVNPGSRPPVRTRRGPTYRVFEGVVARALVAQPGVKRDARHVAVAIWACVHGVVALHLARPVALPREEFAEVAEVALESCMTLFQPSDRRGARRS